MTLLLAVVLVGVACTGTTEVGPTPTPPPASNVTASPSPSAAFTLIGGQPVPVDEVAAIERAVRGYFGAFAASDFDALDAQSTGEVATLAGWQRILSSAFQGTGVLQPAGALVESVKVVSVQGDSASVDIVGQINESFFEQTTGQAKLVTFDITGSVSLVRSSAWQITDYTREGSSVGDQTFTNVQGTKTVQGITVTAVGVDLRPKGTVLMVKVDDHTGLSAEANRAQIKLASGTVVQTGFETNVILLEVEPGSETITGFYFPKSLPSDTKNFDLLLRLFIGCNPACFVAKITVPVQVGG